MKQDPIAIATGAGSDTRFGGTKKDPKAREKKWEIAWESANLAVVDGKQSGYMFKVSGQVFEAGLPSAKFTAARAEADKAANRLILDGGISVESIPAAKSAKTEMHAKKVEWLADYELFKASGEVFLDGPEGAIGPVDVLYVSDKLKRAASSLSYFEKAKAISKK